MLHRLVDEDALPTQLYLSTNASNRNMFYRINRPRHRDAWERWLQSLRFLATVDTRTVLRMTMIREYNDNTKILDELAEMIRQANPHFIELKSYMHIGMSTQRLQKNNMLEMGEVRNFASQLHDKITDFSIMDESEISRVIVLQNDKRYVSRWINGYSPLA